MTIKKALALSDSLSAKCKRGEPLTDLEWAVRALAGGYRRQKDIIKRHEKAARRTRRRQGPPKAASEATR